MTRTIIMRPLQAGLVLALAASALTGCSWFRREAPYLDSTESRPLEVPPDLVLPSSGAALQIPPAAAGSAVPGEAPPAVASPATTFTITDTAENAFRRVGLALGRIDGVSAKPVAALSSHEVSYRGQSFLVRLAAQGEVVKVDAISPAGEVVTGGVAGELLGALRARLQ